MLSATAVHHDRYLDSVVLYSSDLVGSEIDFQDEVWDRELCRLPGDIVGLFFESSHESDPLLGPAARELVVNIAAVHHHDAALRQTIYSECCLLSAHVI